MEQLLVKVIGTYPGESLRWLVDQPAREKGDTRTCIEMAEFFLQLPHLRDLELFYWQDWLRDN
jgi:hypothetical protein